MRGARRAYTLPQPEVCIVVEESPPRSIPPCYHTLHSHYCTHTIRGDSSHFCWGRRIELILRGRQTPVLLPTRPSAPPFSAFHSVPCSSAPLSVPSSVPSSFSALRFQCPPHPVPLFQCPLSVPSFQQPGLKTTSAPAGGQQQAWTSPRRRAAFARSTALQRGCSRCPIHLTRRLFGAAGAGAGGRLEEGAVRQHGVCKGGRAGVTQPCAQPKR